MGGERWWNRKIPARKAEWALFALAMIALVLLPLPRRAFINNQLDGLSSHGLALAAHLSPERHFLMYNRVVLDEDGVERVEPYNRFPIASFALIRGATAFGGPDLIDKFVCARKLMLAFLLGAMFCAYRAFRRLRPGSWNVPVVVALAFSSRYCLYYGDMVFNDVPALFGCMLAFHGFVVYRKEKRFGQLLAKSLVAVTLGWQAFAMILPMAAFVWLKDGARHDALRLAACSVALGTLLLAFNFANESIATGRPFLEMPSVQSALGRTGLAEQEAYSAQRTHERPMGWAEFAKQQVSRAVYAAVPALASSSVGVVRGLFSDGSPSDRSCTNARLLAAFAPVTVLAAFPLLVLLFRRRKISVDAAVPLFALAAFWSFPMKNFTMIHEFQGLFWIGVPLVFYDALFAMLPKRSLVCPLLLVLALFAGTDSFLRLDESKMLDSAGSIAPVAMLQSEARKLEGAANPVVFVDGPYSEIAPSRHVLGCALPQAVFASRIEQADYVLHVDPVRVERRR